jgi:hypothetical protein
LVLYNFVGLAGWEFQAKNRFKRAELFPVASQIVQSNSSSNNNNAPQQQRSATTTLRNNNAPQQQQP